METKSDKEKDGVIHQGIAKRSDIEVEVADGILFIDGKSPEAKEDFVHKGNSNPFIQKSITIVRTR